MMGLFKPRVIDPRTDPPSLIVMGFSESLSPAMEVIRGWERDRRQEIRGQALRGGARSTQRFDPFWQAVGAATDEGAHLAECGRIGCGRRLERQPDCRGSGYQHRQCRADETAIG